MYNAAKTVVITHTQLILLLVPYGSFIILLPCFAEGKPSTSFGFTAVLSASCPLFVIPHSNAPLSTLAP